MKSIVSAAIGQIKIDKNNNKNYQKIKKLVSEASEKGADIICFPECIFSRIDKPAEKKDLAWLKKNMSNKKNYCFN